MARFPFTEAYTFHIARFIGIGMGGGGKGRVKKQRSIQVLSIFIQVHMYARLRQSRRLERGAEGGRETTTLLSRQGDDAIREKE